MDPNETLKDLREHAKGCRETCRDDHCMNYADMLEELDEWLTRGGFLPSDWEGSRPKDATTRACPNHPDKPWYHCY